LAQTALTAVLAVPKRESSPCILYRFSNNLYRYFEVHTIEDETNTSERTRQIATWVPDEMEHPGRITAMIIRSHYSARNILFSMIPDMLCIRTQYVPFAYFERSRLMFCLSVLYDPATLPSSVISSMAIA
jgi:hypothetical protein